MTVALSLPNIVITGSWRSGTTLLYLYFPVAFHDAVISGSESPALDTLLPASFTWRVSKSPNDIHRVREIREVLDPWIIYMLRDPRDCIVSWKPGKNDYHLAFNEWLRNLLFAKSYRGDKLIFVRFEQFVSESAIVQAHLAQDIGLLVKMPFAKCHLHVPPSPIQNQLARGGTGATIRPLDPSVIGSWRRDKARVRQQLEQFLELQAALEWLGYEKDDEWQKDLA
jgi:hypothetical protein